MTHTAGADGLADADRISHLVAAHVDCMDAVCALAATLSLRTGELEAPTAVREALSAILAALGLSELEWSSDLSDLAALATVLHGRIAEAWELARDPARRAGWQPTRRDVMEGQALSSEILGSFARAEVIPHLAGLEARLAAPGGSFLDVGVGAGGLVVSFCRQWPRLSGVGIDIWEPALALAQQRVADAGLGHRIELRHQDVGQLEDRDAYDLTWIPANFIDDQALRGAVSRVRLAARSGGWIILAVLRTGTELLDALARLRVARAGGSPLSPDEAEELLRSAGWEEVQSLAGSVPRGMRLVVGRRPTS